MKKIFLLSALIVSTLYASRNRHVATEWNTDSICLEDDIGKLISEGGWYFLLGCTLIIKLLIGGFIIVTKDGYFQNLMATKESGSFGKGRNLGFGLVTTFILWLMIQAATFGLIFVLSLNCRPVSSSPRNRSKLVIERAGGRRRCRARANPHKH